MPFDKKLFSGYFLESSVFSGIRKFKKYLLTLNLSIEAITFGFDKWLGSCPSRGTHVKLSVSLLCALWKRTVSRMCSFAHGVRCQHRTQHRTG